MKSLHKSKQEFLQVINIRNGNIQNEFIQYRSISECYPFQGLFLRAHYEYYTGNIKYRVDSNYSENFEENALWLGGGYRSTGKYNFTQV